MKAVVQFLAVIGAGLCVALGGYFLFDPVTHSGYGSPHVMEMRMQCLDGSQRMQTVVVELRAGHQYLRHGGSKPHIKGEVVGVEPCQ